MGGAYEKPKNALSGRLDGALIPCDRPIEFGIGSLVNSGSMFFKSRRPFCEINNNEFWTLKSLYNVISGLFR